MFKPNSEPRRGPLLPLPNRRAPALLIAGLCIALLQASSAASAALSVADEPAPSVERSAPAKNPSANGYRLRCWQHGRLLFEEDNIALPPDSSRYALRLAGRDRDGQPLYVAETLNATCLVRPASAPPSNPALPR